MMGVISQFKQHYRRVKADEEGVARSFARLIKAARDIPGMLQERPKVPKYRPRTPYTSIKNRHRVPVAVGIAGAFVRMLDKKPMVFFTDGSLRHVMPAVKPGKSLRKALKRLRMRSRATTARTTSTAA